MAFVYPIMDRRDEKRFVAKAWQDDPRAAVFFDITVFTGCRCSECINWTVVEIKEFLEKGFITIEQGKTGTFREVPINEELEKTLKKYISGKEDHEYLFPSPKHNRQVLSLKRMGQIMRRIALSIGITYNIGTHTGRKTFGWKMKHDLGMSDEDIQEIYGHANVNVTRKYTCIARDFMIKAVMGLKR